MKDIRQIKIIKTQLEKQRDHYLFEKIKLTDSIDKKYILIEKMLSYQSEYASSSGLSLSRSVPALVKNLYSFSNKISDVITQAENEIANMQKIKKSIMQSVNDLDNKIKLMSLFEEREMAEINRKEEQAEQVALDNITTIKFTRSQHE